MQLNFLWIIFGLHMPNCGMHKLLDAHNLTSLFYICLAQQWWFLDDQNILMIIGPYDITFFVWTITVLLCFTNCPLSLFGFLFWFSCGWVSAHFLKVVLPSTCCALFFQRLGSFMGHVLYCSIGTTYWSWSFQFVNCSQFIALFVTFDHVRYFVFLHM